VGSFGGTVVTGKAPATFAFFLILLVAIAGVPEVAAQNGQTEEVKTPIFFWPMYENFSMIPLKAPSCYPLYFGLPPVEIDNKTSALISGTAYMGCPNVSEPVVEILGVESFTMNLNGVNRTFKSVKVAYYTPKPYRIALDLKTTNMTITYRPYNSTYELVLVDISNITLGPKSSTILQTADPQIFGWPRELHLKFAVNKVTGEGYLLENGEKKYLGLFPLLPAPYLSPERYVGGILKRTREFISTMEANPWIVEDILNKVRVEVNSTKASEYFLEFAMNATTHILSPRYSYLGNPATVGFDYLGINSNNTTGVLDFMSWVKRPYNVVTFAGGPMMVNKNEAKKALLAYLGNGNPDPLKDLVLKNALKTTRDPYLIYQIGGGFGIVDFHIPPTTGGILTLPLPSGFNGSYILIMPSKNGSEPFLHVNYDPALYLPGNLTEGWKTLGQCIPYLRSEIVAEISNLLNNASTTETFDASSFEALYPFVKEKLGQCGFNVSEESSTPVTSGVGSENSEGTSESEGKGHGICGPAFLISLAVAPLILRRWRKK